jgi:hypothetical protein
VVFISLTFSSGMPVLYLIVTVLLAVTYWVDKYLLLRFYRLTPGFTKYIYQVVITILPWAAVAHFLFGFIIFSYPSILNTEVNNTIWGEGNQIRLHSLHFNAKRQGQHHMLLFFFAFISVVFVTLFQTPVSLFISALYRLLQACSRFCRRAFRMKHTAIDERGPHFFSDDVYCEYSFDHLYKEYERVHKELQLYQILKSKNKFSAEELKKYVNSYLAILERNEAAIKKRLLELSETHIDRIEDIDPRSMSEDDKIQTVVEYYN